MGGFFGVASKKDCVLELFYGVDYHSHLGTRRAGMATYDKENGFDRSIHSIENTPFRTKFDKDANSMVGNLGIGCISDTEPQPLLMQTSLGSFAITILGKINNYQELLDMLYAQGRHFQEMTSGRVNTTELVSALICTQPTILEGIKYAQRMVDGSMTLLLMNSEGIYAARDVYGRTPIVLGKGEDGYCVSFESHAFINLGFKAVRNLLPGEIVFVTPDKAETLQGDSGKKKVCSFLWTYYGYPSASYEGVNVEDMRYRCGSKMAERDAEAGGVDVDSVAGVPDSGMAAAIGYATESGTPLARPLVKYTPTWARSFMPSNQKQREFIARMKLIPIPELIEDKKLLLIEDSIVRGTQLKDTAEYLYQNGAKEIHVRSACPPLMYGCKYLDFSRSKSDMDLIARRVICDLEENPDVPQEVLDIYADPDTEQHKAMVKEIGKRMGFTSLDFLRLDDLIESLDKNPCELCTYCWSGKE